jgi:hypothetical protein
MESSNMADALMDPGETDQSTNAENAMASEV